MNHFIRLVFACSLVTAIGCGNPGGDTAAPASSELERYLAEHPELNDVQEPDEFAK
jgi:hypothetical protein